MNLLYEHMIRAETERYVCRIWRAEGKGGIDDIALKYVAIQVLNEEDATINDVAYTLINHDRVNSVEVIYRSTGDGVCVHKDWP